MGPVAKGATQILTTTGLREVVRPRVSPRRTLKPIQIPQPTEKDRAILTPRLRTFPAERPKPSRAEIPIREPHIGEIPTVRPGVGEIPTIRPFTTQVPKQVSMQKQPPLLRQITELTHGSPPPPPPVPPIIPRVPRLKVHGFALKKRRGESFGRWYLKKHPIATPEQLLSLTVGKRGARGVVRTGEGLSQSLKAISTLVSGSRKKKRRRKRRKRR